LEIPAAFFHFPFLVIQGGTYTGRTCPEYRQAGLEIPAAGRKAPHYFECYEEIRYEK
jgi:hypothetical protein